jgi:hypothetical protein
MREWRMAGEPSLDELLDDEIMESMMRSAGVDERELRRRLRELSHRLAWRTAPTGSCCGAAC